MRTLRRQVADGLPELDAAFAVGYEARSWNEQKMLQVLGLVDRLGIQTSEAAAAAALPDAEASKRLSALADASLVQAVGPNRWQVPQLVRSFARHQAERLGSSERREILDRLDRYEEARALARRTSQDPDGVRAWLQDGGLDRAGVNRVLEGVARQLLDLSQVGLENLADLLLELIAHEPQHIHAPRTAEEIKNLASTQGRSDLLERVRAWRPLYEASLPVLTPPPAAGFEEEPGVWRYGGPRTFTGREFQPGEQVTVTVDGQHSGGTVADAGGTFSCTVHIPWQPDPPRHAIAIGDAGSRAETFLT